MGNFARRSFLLGGGNLTENDFDDWLIFKAKNNIKIKISMTCVYKEYEVKIEIVKEQWQPLKMKFLIGYNIKIVI